MHPKRRKGHKWNPNRHLLRNYPTAEEMAALVATDTVTAAEPATEPVQPAAAPAEKRKGKTKAAPPVDADADSPDALGEGTA